MQRTEKQKRFIWKEFNNRRDRFIAQYEKQFKKALLLQVAPIIAAVRREENDPLISIDSTPLRRLFIQVYITVGTDFAKNEYRQLKSQIAQLEVKATPTTTGPILESRWLEYMRVYAQTIAGEKIQQIAATTLKLTREVLKKTAELGLSIEQTAKELQSKFEGYSRARGRTIARTEVIGASNRGSFVGAIETGLNLEKEWLVTRGRSTPRPSHAAADEQKRPLKEKFKVGAALLDHPGDPAGPAEEIINCRCIQVYNPIRPKG